MTNDDNEGFMAFSFLKKKEFHAPLVPLPLPSPGAVRPMGELSRK